MAATDTQLSPTEVAHWTRIGALSALAMLLGYLESFLPIPIPGVKLGLANIPILVALAQNDLLGALFVGLVKVGATSLLFGNPVTLAYSLVGTLLAYLVMAPLSRLRTMRLEMVSVMGALAHEAGQLLVAQVLLGTPLVWYSAPVLAVAGCITGVLCGVATQHLVVHMQQGAEVWGSGPTKADGSSPKDSGDEKPTDVTDASPTTPDTNEAFSAAGPACEVPYASPPSISSAFDTAGTTPTRENPSPNAANAATAKHSPIQGARISQDSANQQPSYSTKQAFCFLAAYIAFVIIVMHAQTFSTLVLCLACSLAACLIAHVRPKQLLAALAPTLPIALVTLVAQVATHQQGTVLAAIGPLTLTQQALEAALIMLARLASIAWASVAIAHLIPTNAIVHCTHAMLAPLNHLGLNTAGPELAFSTTLQLIPLLSTRIQALSAQGLSPLSPSFWTNEIPLLLTELLTSSGQRSVDE